MLQEPKKSNKPSTGPASTLCSAGDIRAVIFDCDGVMFDTAKANIAYYNQLLKNVGLTDMTRDKIPYVQMHTVEESIAFLMGNDPFLIESARASQRLMNYAPFIKEMEMEPFLAPLLEYLKPVYATAIATNRTDTMERVLNEFDILHYFDLVVTARDVQKPKPDPESLIIILDRFAILPVQAIYIGDSLVDQQAAESSGVRFVSFRNPGLPADYHVQSLKEVKNILNGND